MRSIRLKDMDRFLEEMQEEFPEFEYVMVKHGEVIIKRIAITYLPKIRNMLDFRSWIGQILYNKKKDEYFFIFGETGCITEPNFNINELNKISTLLEKYNADCEDSE